MTGSFHLHCHPRKVTARPGGSTLSSRARRAYFQEATVAGVRYGVTLNRFAAHIGWLRKQHGRSLRTYRHTEDLLLVIACVDGHAIAQRDLVEIYGPLLTLALEQLAPEMENSLRVGRFLAELRRRLQCHASGWLDRYDGRRSLRHHLLTVLLEWEQASARGSENRPGFDFPLEARHGPLDNDAALGTVALRSDCRSIGSKSAT